MKLQTRTAATTAGAAVALFALARLAVALPTAHATARQQEMPEGYVQILARGGIPAEPSGAPARHRRAPHPLEPGPHPRR